MLQVSVVVPTYNRLSRLRQVIDGLERQTYPLDQFEVIVVSDGSTDGTHAYLESIETPLRLSYVAQANQGPAAARNNGISLARGELVLFVDDDVVPEPELIVEHLRVHSAEGDGVVVLGPMLTPADFAMAPWVYYEQAMLVKQYIAMQEGRWAPTARQFYTGNTSLARRHLVEAGGFDSRLRRAEDVELAYRLAARGLRFVFNPQAIGYHYAERSFRSWMEIPYAYGRNDVIFAREKQQEWILPTARTEFHKRHPLIRLLMRACIDRERLGRGTTAALRLVAGLGERLGMRRVSQLAFSGIFNLRYYQGMADEIGGRQQFFSTMGLS